MLWILMILLTAPVASSDEPAGDLTEALRAAQAAERWNRVIEVANLRLKQHPDDIATQVVRGTAWQHLRKWPEAIRDYDRALAAHPNDPHLLHSRGTARFCSGDVVGGLADFDAEVAAKPEIERQHWQRGLAHYLAGKFHAGAKQFALYQTYYGADVENIAWHMACVARDTNWKQATSQRLDLTGIDRRVPLMTVYSLFRGEAKPEDVLATVESHRLSGDEAKLASFYAHLYLALYHDARQQVTERDRHLAEAVRRKMDHYMWDVANVWQQSIAKSKNSVRPEEAK